MKCVLSISAIALSCIAITCSPTKKNVVLPQPDPKKQELPKEEMEDVRVMKLGESFSIDLPGPSDSWHVVYDKKTFRVSESQYEHCFSENNCLSVTRYELETLLSGETIIEIQLKNKATVVESHTSRIIIVEDPAIDDELPSLTQYLDNLPRSLALKYLQPTVITLKPLPYAYQYQFVANPAGFSISRAYDKVTVIPRAIGKSSIVIRIIDSDMNIQTLITISVEISFADAYTTSVGEPFLVQTFVSASPWQVISDHNELTVSKEKTCQPDQDDCVAAFALTATAPQVTTVSFSAEQETYKFTLTSQ